MVRDRLLHFFESSRLGALGKKSAMNVFRSVAAGLADDEVVAMAMPFENRTWPYAELFSDFSGNGDLSLGGDLRLRY